MAMAIVRTVGTWSSVRVSGAGAASGVSRCAVETAGKAQRVSTRRAVKGAGQNAMSTGGEIAQVRCQAARTSTAVREVAVTEKITENRCLEESRAALRENFQVVGVRGRVECVGTHQECRLVMDMAFEQSRMHYGRRGAGDAYMAGSMNPVDPAEAGEADEVEVQMGKGDMVAAFEAALREAGRNAQQLGQLAAQAWRKLGDADRAEQLFTQALQLAPDDSAIQASYAQFLWQCDA